MAYNPEQIAEEFFEAVRRVHALGAGTPETAYYPALNTLFERVGASLRPKVLPVSQLANTGGVCAYADAGTTAQTTSGKTLTCTEKDGSYSWQG